MTDVRAPDRVSVEPMALEHLTEVRRIDGRCYEEPWSEQLWRNELARGDDRCYKVAYVGDELVGMAGALRALDELHIVTVATDPDRQGRGVASWLVLGVIRDMLSRGCTSVTLEVRAGNRRAQALYQRFGLAPAGIRRGYYEPENEDALIMWAHDADLDPYLERLDRIETELRAATCGDGS